MKFSAFIRRRQAVVMTSVAAVPIHGLEKNADGVLLHIGIKDGKPMFLEVPRAQAQLVHDYLARALASLEHWDERRRTFNESRIAIPEIDFIPPARLYDKTWDWLER